MNVRVVEWLMDDHLIEAVQYGVVECWPPQTENHTFHWELKDYNWFLAAVGAGKWPEFERAVKNRMNRAVKCFKDGQPGGRLWVRHHCTVISNPNDWAPRDSALVAVSVIPKAKEFVRSIMQERMGRWSAPVCRNIYIGWPQGDERENRARVTLRDMIGRKAYAVYIRKGFVSFTGKSGKHYQVFPGRTLTRVFEKGSHTGSLCAVFSEGPNEFQIILEGTLRNMGVPVANTRGAERVEVVERVDVTDSGQVTFCPTDQLIMRLVLLMADESHFESLCNKHPPHDPYGRPVRVPLIKTDNRNLNEIYRDIQQLVA